MDSQSLRRAFLDFFGQQDHKQVASASLVPDSDPTLLFTNAGMVPFKAVFLGQKQLPYQRAVSIQRCVRAGGKHNDLDNVGYTARHHTFFEMMGNFSFGDYFKKQAITMAWQFVTQILKLPADKLWITVFEQDDEAYDIWLNTVGVEASRISRLGTKDNFWSMGDTGPCGPCTEIFYDHGPDIWGGPPGSAEEDGDRYIEIWNLVFMQYNRQSDGSLHDLPSPSVDTGMGLERVAAILQGKHDNYDIDTFQYLIKAAADIIGVKDLKARSLRVIADHIRSCAFLITDGVVPSNEGRGYVLRRIIRRAIRHGDKLGAQQMFFYRLVRPLVEIMGSDYPELAASQVQVERILEQEEQQFLQTLRQGLQILNGELAQLTGDTLPGELVFKLYDTYGFPVDLTADIAREHKLAVDFNAFNQYMAEQRQRARAASQFKVDYSEAQELAITSNFIGYDQLTTAGLIELLLDDNGKQLDTIAMGQSGALVLNDTPFYPESGGQVGDQGEITTTSGRFYVDDTQKQGSTIIHHGRVLAGELTFGQRATATIDANRRQHIVRNHSATHLLHAALRQVLGTHVSQKGSLVAPDRLRFDFTHFAAITPSQWQQIEQLVNEQIRANHAAEIIHTSIDEAKARGAIALFNDTYQDQVRVLKMGDFSMELCGGTHVIRTGDIGFCHLLHETGIASGVRRIEAVTGEFAVKHVQNMEQAVTRACALVKGSSDDLVAKVAGQVEREKDLAKQIQTLKGQMASLQADRLLAQAQQIDDLLLVTAKLTDSDSQMMRTLVDELKNKIDHGIVVLAAQEADKARLIVGVTPKLSKTLAAGNLIKSIAPMVDGKGGGKPELAQAGGSSPEKIAAALSEVASLVRAALGGKIGT